MPIVGNRTFSDPNIGQAFSNIASMFAPPSGSDLAGYASARDSSAAAALKKQKLDEIATLFDMAQRPDGFNQSIFDRGNIVAGNYAPTQSFYAQDQNNATDLSKNRLDNQTKFVGDMFGPVSQDAMRPAVPADVASMFGVNHDLPQVTGLRSPLSETQVKGGILTNQIPNMTPDQLTAIAMSDAKTANVIGPDGKPVVDYNFQSVGKQPAYAPSATQSAYQQTTDKSYAETDMAIQKDAAGARGTMNTVDAMRTLMTDPNFYSGPASDQIQAAKQIGSMLGLTVPDAASPMEAFNGLSNQLIIDAAGGSLGNQISNGDVKFLQGSKPNLGNTPAGNKLLLDIASKLAKRKMEVAQWAQEYKDAHGGQIDGGWTAFEKQKAEAAPLFPPIAETQPATGGVGGAPAVGAVEDGYRFNGGDPSDPNSWSPAGGQ